MTTPRDPGTGHAVYRPRPRSRRRLWWGLLITLVVLGGLSGGGVYALRSDSFSVLEVSSGPYRFTDGGDLDRILGSFLHRNLWTLSATEVADSLAVLPWVKDLQVHRELPGRIEVEFSERRPVLSLEGGPDGNQLLVLADDGRVLPFPRHLPAPALPVLVGVDCVRDSLDGRLGLAPLWAPRVQDLLDALAATGLESVAPIDFLVARSEGFAIVLQEGWGTLLVGHEDFSTRLDRYLAAREHLEPGLQMDLRFRERIVCRRN